MDQKNFIVAIVLSVLIIVGWQAAFPPAKPTVAPTQQQAGTASTAPGAPATPAGQPVAPGVQPGAEQRRDLQGEGATPTAAGALRAAVAPIGALGVHEVVNRL